MRYLCGTPKQYCKGSLIGCNAGLGKGLNHKAHSSSADAFKCYKSYKINHEDYEEIGSRELRAKDGSGVLVLAKQSKFGAPLRKGKGSDKGSRWQAKGRAASGTVIKL